MADIFDEVATTIIPIVEPVTDCDSQARKAILLRRRDDIAALLRERFGRTIEAAHLFLDEAFAGCSMKEDTSAYVVNLAKLLNRWHSNGDGTGSVTEKRGDA